MDKVYLLLRNNRQTGPYHLEELLQQQLQPNDLIWVEGKSMGWSYPAEWEELKSYIKQPETILAANTNNSTDIPDNPKTPLQNAGTSRHIYVSLPVNHLASNATTADKSLEEQAEALRKKIEAYSRTHKPLPTGENQPPAYMPKNISDLQKDYTAWLHQQTKNKKNRFYKRMGVAAFIMLLLSGGYILAKDRLLAKETAALTVNHTLKSETNQSAKSNRRPIPQNTYPEIIAPDTMAAAAYIPTAISTGKNSRHNKGTIAAIKIPVPTLTDMENDKPPVLLDNTKINITQQESASEATINTAKNNTLGSKISRLFKKHKRPDVEEKSDDWTAKADVTFTSTINPSGTQSLQLTLHNRSGETIKAAVIEVRYYNKRNDVIEKRLVHFKSVLPNDTATQTINSNRLTDHIYYQLLSADN